MLKRGICQQILHPADCASAVNFSTRIPVCIHVLNQSSREPIRFPRSPSSTIKRHRARNLGCSRGEIANGTALDETRNPPILREAAETWVRPVRFFQRLPGRHSPIWMVFGLRFNQPPRILPSPDDFHPWAIFPPHRPAPKPPPLVTSDSYKAAARKNRLPPAKNPSQPDQAPSRLADACFNHEAGRVLIKYTPEMSPSVAISAISRTRNSLGFAAGQLIRKRANGSFRDK